MNTYLTLKYNSKNRWLSYWYQISEAISRNPESLLVIGKGSGIVETTIKSLAPQITVVTLDINRELSPDLVGNIIHLPFKDRSFSGILCCQVFEHIPFEQIGEVLKEFKRIVNDFVVISVPHRRKHIKFEIDAPVMGQHRIILKYPFKKKTIKSKQHYWEINRGISYRELKEALTRNFLIEKTFLNELNCIHRFFILRKRN